MRVESWNPNAFDQTFEDVAIERLIEAAKVVAARAKQNCPVGTISRPMYKSGPHAGKDWTSRDAGRLKKSIRTARQRTKSGKAFSRKKNVRVYAGESSKSHNLAWYAAIVEYSKAYLRPAFDSSISEIKNIVGAK